MPLTDSKLRALKPKEKPYPVPDADGLFAYVAPTGSISWRWKYKFHGKSNVHSMGRYPAVGLANARELLKEAKRNLAAGRDPNEVKKLQKIERAEASEMTFGVFVERLIAKKTAEGKAEATIKSMRKRFAHAKPLMARPIGEITAVEVLGVLRAIEKQGHYETAHRLLGSSSEVFRFAVAEGRIVSDPTRDLRGVLVSMPPKRTDAIVDPEGFGALIRAIKSYENIVVRSALEFLALTAARPGEVRGALWGEFDLEKREWRIPAKRAKMRKEHLVPLSDQAVALIKDMRQFSENPSNPGAHVFPGNRNGRSLSENTFNSALAILGFGKGKHTAHGFRSSFSTIANESELWSEDVIEKALAHDDGSTIRGRYARHDLVPTRRKLLEWWADQVAIMASLPNNA